MMNRNKIKKTKAISLALLLSLTAFSAQIRAAEADFTSESEEDENADTDYDAGIYIPEDEDFAEENAEEDAVISEFDDNSSTPEETFSLSAPIVLEDDVETNRIEGWPAGPSVSAGSALVLESETGTVLYAKNPDAVLDPGSTVKMMTVLLALENASLEDEVTMTDTGIMGVTDGGLTISAQLGETFTMQQCLYAIVLASANDISIQVAEHIGGTVDNFIKMMNTRASELGCTNTVFTNPTGLEDPNQHSSAHDIAIIMQACLAQETYRTIARTLTYTIPATNVSGGERVLTNSFGMVSPSDPDYYEGTLGGKQGFTETSGTTLLCAAEKKDRTLICALLQGGEDTAGTEAAQLLDYGFQNFSLEDLSAEEFDILSGGIVLLPGGRSSHALTHEDVQDGENLHRTYLFNGIPVGTAIVQPVLPEDDIAVQKDLESLEAAKAFSENKSIIPYFVIGAIALLVLVLLGRQLKK